MSQSFRTITAPINTLALYQLSIRSPGYQRAEIATYTFPLTPSAVRYDRSGASSYTDTQGTPSTEGITRTIDRFGLTPPVIDIEGTTGWDYHASDGGVLTGLQSMQLLQSFLEQYATLNDQQRQTGNTQYYSLEFYDYFLSQFWVVEPVGKQILRLSADRPLLSYYKFRWAAERAVSAPTPPAPDPLLALFQTPAQVVASALSTTLGVFLAAYTPVGLPTVSTGLIVPQLGYGSSSSGSPISGPSYSSSAAITLSWYLG